MFDWIREHKKIGMGFFLILVIPGFVLFGVDSFIRTQKNDRAVAEVNGQSITQADWDAAHQRFIQQYRQQAKQPEDLAQLEGDVGRNMALDALMEERLLQQMVEKLGLSISDGQLARQLAQDPSLQAFKQADGRLDVKAYQAALLQQGMTPATYEAKLRAAMALDMVWGVIGRTRVSQNVLAETNLQAILEHRLANLWLIPFQAFESKIDIKDEQIVKQFEKDSAKYVIDETVDLEWLWLDLPSVEKQQTASDAELKAYYDQNQARYATPEQRQASHILIAASKGSTPEQRHQAKTKAESLLAELKQKPTQFAEYAKKHSADPGSAKEGGVLPAVGKGDGQFVKPFEDAVFALKMGELSPVVESDFGYHIITLKSITPATSKPFEQVKPQLLQEVQKQQAKKAFEDKKEWLTNEVGALGRASLANLAKKVNLPLLQLKGLDSQGLVKEPAINIQLNMAAHPEWATQWTEVQKQLKQTKFVKAVFDKQVLSKEMSTDLIELSNKVFVVAKVIQHTPKRAQTLDEVRPQIKAGLVAEAAKQQSQEKGKAWLKNLQDTHQEATAIQEIKGLSGFQQLDQIPISRMQQKIPLPPSVIETILATSSKSLPQWVGVATDQGYVLAKVTGEGTLTTEEQQFLATEKPKLTTFWEKQWNAWEQAALRKTFETRLESKKLIKISESTSSTSK